MRLIEFLTEGLSNELKSYRRLPFTEFVGQNRRFIFDPVSHRMIIGRELPRGRSLEGSHAEDWFDITGSNKFFDRCIRGWVGMDRGTYRNGVIHFAPPVSPTDERTLACIEYFIRNGAGPKCKTRGVLTMNEMLLGNLFPEFFSTV